MEIFKGQNLIEFSERFKTDLCCKEYLSYLKWSEGYVCLKCGHEASQQRKDFSRTCNKCSHTESSTANTLFHKVKFGLRKAFFICFEMTTTTKSLSASYMAVRYGITENTARLFMHKVREAMKSSGNHPMDGHVEVDEFVLGGYEEGKVGRSYNAKKKKAVTALQLSDDKKVKRMYVRRIGNFSAKELEGIFHQHISKSAQVRTDGWKAYLPIKSQGYAIEQEQSDAGRNFQILHTMIHQIKSWIRTTYGWVSDQHIQRYFDEFCYRLNRSQSKNTIFNNLIQTMVSADKIYHRNLVCN